MKRIYLRKNNIVAGQFIAMGSEALVPDKIADDLIYRGQAHLLEEVPDQPEKPKKTRKKKA